MTTWFRVHKYSNPLHVFSGEGGLLVPGRWNHKGKKAIYCSESIALATLEWLSHNGLSVSGFSYHRFSIEIPDSKVIHFDVGQMPTDWIATPSTDAGRDFSNEILYSTNGPLAISVPSVLVPEEKNLVINPLHPDFIEVVGRISSLGPFLAPLR